MSLPPLARPSFVVPPQEKGHCTEAESAAVHRRMSGLLKPPTTTVGGCTPQNCHRIPGLSVQRWRWRTITTSYPCATLPRVRQFMSRHQLLSNRRHRRLFWLFTSCNDDQRSRWLCGMSSDDSPYDATSYNALLWFKYKVLHQLGLKDTYKIYHAPSLAGCIQYRA